MENFDKILTQMGYRKLKPGVWAKPVSFHLFMFEMDKMLWTNFFKSADNSKMLIWNTETYKEDDWKINDEDPPNFLYFLKYTEHFTRIDVRGTDSEFEFLTEEEMYKLIL